MKHLSTLSAVILIVVTVGSAFSQNINTPENFPDPEFRKVVEEFMGIDPGGEFTAAEAAANTGELDCSSLGITDMTGLEYFTGITYLSCMENDLTSLDVSANQQLEVLDINDQYPLD